MKPRYLVCVAALLGALALQDRRAWWTYVALSSWCLVCWQRDRDQITEAKVVKMRRAGW